MNLQCAIAGSLEKPKVTHPPPSSKTTAAATTATTSTVSSLTSSSVADSKSTEEAPAKTEDLATNEERMEIDSSSCTVNKVL